MTNQAPSTRALIAAVAIALSPATVQAASAPIDFNRDIRPILSDNCFFCHGFDEHERKAGLRLDTLEGATADHDGVRAVVPGDPAASELVHRITSADPDEVMPPPESHKKLDPAQVDLLQRWVAEGAPWAEHWAFEAPIKPPVPAVADPAGIRNPIDAFVRARLAAEGLEPSPEADKATLLRRVTFDLTGLPPTPEELDAFLADASPDAFEKVVDRLLAKPAFGERMALAWMDIARYGDTSVMHADGPRDMWPWRDWVIDAYNANMPFDRFTVEQIAGDLIPEATIAQKIASGFNRNHATSDEGGAIPEELRVSYVVDRVQTTSNAWLGLSMECAQCHEHKYDPISQREYYQVFAYFNQTKDGGMQTRNGNADPVVRFFADPELEQRHETKTAELAAARAAVDAHRGDARPAYEAWVARLEAQGVESRPEPPGLAHRFVARTGGVDGEGQEASPVVEDVVTGVTGAVEGPLAVVDRDGAGDPGIAFANNANAAFPGDAIASCVAADRPFTLAAWIRAPKDGNASGAVIARMDDANAHRGFDLWTQGGEVGTHIVSAWPDDAIKVVSKEKLKPDTWQHVVVSYDGSRKAAGVSIFIDGRKAGNKVEKDALKGEIANGVPLRIGRRDTSAPCNSAVADTRIYGRVLEAHERERIGTDFLGTVLAKAPADRSDEETKRLFEHYLDVEDAAYQDKVAARDRLDAEVVELEKQRISSMIMSDLEKPRPTYVLDRGAYDAPREDEEVQPGVPAVLPPLPADAPPNRLGFARWLVQPGHPLTARVAVNRYWAMLFGTGIVKTVADFGSQGEAPSHPALLDWLAVDFVEHGWDIKRTLRQIVTSATYRQSSRVTPELEERDPGNRLLARGPRFRLQGEFIRDNALAVSGLLVDQVGGPGVKPYQPPGLWNEVSLDGNVRFVQDKGDKLHRRSMYIYWKRSAPHPGMMAFDAPTRETCTMERARTNTPLQALVTLNDAQFVEAARAFAERILTTCDGDTECRLRAAFRLATAREPDAGEMAVLTASLERHRAYFREHAERAAQLLATGEAARDESLDPVEHAAWTNLASMLLNLDEVLTRG